ncbi:hypothetical protein ACQPU1_06320 [Clostridium paraputrificum]|uniref:hypothetical protein n=1 Tax=Clostridium paraputrificum TaxID=29363 RepID=UPI003D343270
MARKRDFKMSKSDLAYEDEIDEASFIDYVPPTGDYIADFSFTDEITIPIKETSNVISTPSSSNYSNIVGATLTPDIDIFDNRTTPIANGAAPSINGETPNLKRTYLLRTTTIKKLNELKAIHSDTTTCVSTIVDVAIEHYYDCIKERGINR